MDGLAYWARCWSCLHSRSISHPGPPRPPALPTHQPNLSSRLVLQLAAMHGGDIHPQTRAPYLALGVYYQSGDRGAPAGPCAVICTRHMCTALRVQPPPCNGYAHTQGGVVRQDHGRCVEAPTFYHKSVSLYRLFRHPKDTRAQLHTVGPGCRHWGVGL